MIMAINKAEDDSCTMQIARDYYNFSDSLEDFQYHEHPKFSELLDFAIDTMLEMSIPMIFVDYTLKQSMDKQRVKGMTSTTLAIEYLYVFLNSHINYISDY